MVGGGEKSDVVPSPPFPLAWLREAALDLAPHTAAAGAGAEKPSGSWSFLFYAHPSIINEAGASTTRPSGGATKWGAASPTSSLLPKLLQTNSLETAAAGTPARRPTPPAPSRSAREASLPLRPSLPTFDPPSQPFPFQAQQLRLRLLPQGNETAGSSCPLPLPWSSKATHPNPSPSSPKEG